MKRFPSDLSMGTFQDFPPVLQTFPPRNPSHRQGLDAANPGVVLQVLRHPGQRDPVGHPGDGARLGQKGQVAAVQGGLASQVGQGEVEDHLGLGAEPQGHRDPEISGWYGDI